MKTKHIKMLYIVVYATLDSNSSLIVGYTWRQSIPKCFLLLEVQLEIQIYHSSLDTHEARTFQNALKCCLNSKNLTKSLFFIFYFSFSFYIAKVEGINVDCWLVLTVGFWAAAIFVVLIVVSFLELFYLAVHGFNWELKNIILLTKGFFPIDLLAVYVNITTHS